MKALPLLSIMNYYLIGINYPIIYIKTNIQVVGGIAKFIFVPFEYNRESHTRKHTVSEIYRQKN